MCGLFLNCLEMEQQQLYMQKSATENHKQLSNIFTCIACSSNNAIFYMV